MAEKKIHKGYRLTQETLKEMKDISEWYGDIDQTQVLTIAVAEMWHSRAGEMGKRRGVTKKKELVDEEKGFRR
jgi:hypothetical protein